MNKCDRQPVLELIQKARSNRFITNCYSDKMVDRIKKYWCRGDEFIFSYEDHGVDRLVYFVQNWDALERMISVIDPGQYYLEFLSKDDNELMLAGNLPIARMMRLANADCRSIFDDNSPVLQYRNPSVGKPASVDEAGEINGILWSVFRTEISHLLTDDELGERIAQQQILIHRNGQGAIDAILQTELMPKKLYINQVINQTNKDVIHAMMLSRIEEYISKGGKYLYAWVERDNIASMKFHGKYGMKHDGMYSLIYDINVTSSCRD